MWEIRWWFPVCLKWLCILELTILFFLCAPWKRCLLPLPKQVLPEEEKKKRHYFWINQFFPASLPSKRSRFSPEEQHKGVPTQHGSALFIDSQGTLGYHRPYKWPLGGFPGTVTQSGQHKYLVKSFLKGSKISPNRKSATWLLNRMLPDSWGGRVSLWKRDGPDSGKATSATTLFFTNGLSSFILDRCLFYLQILEAKATDGILRKSF